MDSTTNIDPWGQGTYAVGPLRVKQKILDSLDAPVSIYAAKIDRIFVSILGLQLLQRVYT